MHSVLRTCIYNKRKESNMQHERSGKVNLNSATIDELAGMPMIGKDKAETIISHRPFKSWDELRKVPGFSQGLIDDLKDSATI
jgi:competence ComEA-like helix-hairpin-helix protein